MPPRWDGIGGERFRKKNHESISRFNVCLPRSVVGGLAVSISLFISGMGEGLCIVLPIALLGATMLLLHSIVTRRRDLLFSAIAVLMVIVLVWMTILFV
jgi:hypothetical protein